ncbi:MFS transporter [Streptomyces cheonanensis]|uniref:MFS transporter n=1 Tax=Streptomyces cheonanensis TaxID=312720 RepID=A0ABP5GXM1_9ACTN
MPVSESTSPSAAADEPPPAAGEGPPGAARGGFARLWGASTASNLGDGVTMVAFPWLATTLTDDAFLIAAMGVALRLPWLLFSLPAGVLADRLDRRRVMVTMNAARALVICLLGLLVAADAHSLPVLYLCALALGFAEVLVDNTAQVILPAVVGKDGLALANGRLMSTQIVTDDFVGRPLGGVLLGVSLALPFAFGAGAAAIAAVLLLTLRGTYRAAPAAPGPRRPVRAEIAEGVRWLWAHPLLRPLAVALALLNTAGAAVLAIQVLYAREILGLGSLGFAVFTAASGVGGLLGGLLAHRVTRRIGRVRSLMLLLVLELGAYVVGAVSSSALLVGAVVAVAGFGAVLWNVVTVSLRQALVPDALLGRVNSVYRLLGWGCLPVGMVVSGALVTLVEHGVGREAGLRTPFVLAAVLTCGTFWYLRRHLTARTLPG